MIRPITKYPDPLLRQKTEPIKTFGNKEKLLVRDMIDTMHAEHGVGIGANQIGVPVRIFVACPEAARGTEKIYLNPRIIKKYGAVRETEGCLSIPGFFDTVTRFRKVTLEALDVNMEPITVQAEGFLARIFQHEIDHLNGKLFIDRLNFLARRRLLKKIQADLGKESS